VISVIRCVGLTIEWRLDGYIPRSKEKWHWLECIALEKNQILDIKIKNELLQCLLFDKNKTKG
jgi:hypothetical protein